MFSEHLAVLEKDGDCRMQRWTEVQAVGLALQQDVLNPLLSVLLPPLLFKAQLHRERERERE